MYDGEVLRAAAEYGGIELDDLLGPRRYKSLIKARRVAAIALRILDYSYPQIGMMLGRDHTSIINLVNRADDEAWEVAHGIVKLARQRTFVLRFQPQKSFTDPTGWKVINPRTDMAVSLPLGLSEDLSAALQAGGMDE